VDKLIWLKGSADERQLWLRSTAENQAVSEIIIQSGRQADVLDSVQIAGHLVRTMRCVRSYGCREFKFPMTIPHTRVLVPTEQEQNTREWCRGHGFEDVVANSAETIDERYPIARGSWTAQPVCLGRIRMLWP